MGKLVNVTLPNGKVAAVTPEEAARLQAAPEYGVKIESGAQAAEREKGVRNADRASGIAQGAKALTEGFVDTVSGGLYGLAADAIAPEYAGEMRNRGVNRPGAHLVGEIGGYLSGVGAVKGAAAVGEGVAARAIGGAARPLTKGAETAYKVVQRGVEGGLLGGVGEVVRTNSTGDALTVSGLVTSVGVAGILDIGIGRLGDSLVGAGSRAKAKLAAEAEADALRATVEQGRDMMTRSPAYANFKATHNDVRKATSDYLSKRQGELAKHATGITPDTVKKGVEQLRKNRLDVQVLMQETGFARAVKAADGEFAAATKAYDDELAAAIEAHDEAFAAAELEYGKSSRGAKKAHERLVRDAERAHKAQVGEAKQAYDAEVGAAKATRDAGVAAEKQAAAGYEREVKAFTDLAGNQEKWAVTTRQFTDFIADLEHGRIKAPIARAKGANAKLAADHEAALAKWQTSASRVEADYGRALKNHEKAVAAAEKAGTPLPAPPVKGELPPKPVAPKPGHVPEETGAHVENVKAFKDRLSQIMKRQAGWKVESGKWHPGGAPDAEAAIAELAALKDDIRKAYPNATTKGGKGLPEIPRVPGPVPRVNAPADLAAGIQDAGARAAKFGDRKAYVSSLYENLDPAIKPATLDEFKAQLLAAHKRGEVTLSRGDLVAAMDADMLAASRIDANGAEFNFVTMADAPPAPAPRGAFTPAEFVPPEFTPPTPPVKGEAPVGGPRPVRRDPNAVPGWDDLTLQASSKDIDGTTQRVVALQKAGRYEEAAREIEALEVRTRAAGLGELTYPKYPKAPRAPVPELMGRLPKDLEEFARMNDRRVGELADYLDGLSTVDEAAVAAGGRDAFAVARRELGEEFASIADELGLARLGTPGETAKAVWAKLREFPKAMDKLEALGLKEAVKAGRAKKGFLGQGMELGKKGVKFGVGRAFDSGGMKGAFMRTMAGGAVGYGMDGAEGAYLGGMLMSGKLGVRNRLTKIVAAVGGPLGRGALKMAPVTAYLSARWPTGEEDDEPDLRNRAHNRIDDVLRMASVAPDAAFVALEGLAGHPGDVQFKAHQMAVGAMNHLAEMAPKDPGTDTTLRGSNWRPSSEQSIAFAHRIEAVVDPMSAIERSVSGDTHPAATETLWAVWAPLMEEFAAEFASAPRTLPFEAEARMAKLLRVQVGLQQPVVLASLQGMYLPQPTPPGEGTPSSTPNPGGRPAAVQSKVAGSSVAGLTS